jgi:hypothetical protein
MSKSKFNREFYLSIAQSEGIPAALTRLQSDAMKWEYQTFEGPEGYQPKAWDALNEVREFARELWEMDLQRDTNPPKTN